MEPTKSKQIEDELFLRRHISVDPRKNSHKTHHETSCTHTLVEQDPKTQHLVNCGTNHQAMADKLQVDCVF